MKNSKILDTVVSLLKEATSLKLKKKEIKNSDFVLFQTTSSFIEGCVYLDFAESEAFVKKLNKKYNVPLAFTAGMHYSVSELATNITEFKNQIKPFSFGTYENCDEGSITSNQITVNNNSFATDSDPYFWDVFDEWYMKNRKKLLASGEDTKVKQKKNKNENKGTKSNSDSLDAMH